MKRQTLSHGLSYTPEYRAWQTMRQRCTNPRCAAWPRYGGRGISIAAEWLTDPAAFIAHIGPKPSPKHELDRIDNERGYVPGNVRWATRKTNDRNRRSNRRLAFRGESLTIAEWAERVGISRGLIRVRLENGWSVERTLTEPARATSPRGTQKSFTTPCVDCGKAARGTRCRPCENRNRAIQRGAA